MLWRQPGAVRVLITVPQFASEEYPEIWMPASSIPYWSATNAQQGDDVVRLIEDARGWPLLALRCSFEDASSGKRTYDVVNGVYLRPHPTEVQQVSGMPAPPFVLPLRPIWPGFVADLLMYASFWFALWFGLGRARAFVRRRGGRCPSCGYDLRGTSGGGGGCPECGWRREEKVEA